MRRFAVFLGLILLSVASAHGAAIDNGSGSTQVDVTNEAIRTYDTNSSGTETGGGAPTGSYAISSPVLRQTGTTAAGSYIISFRNGATKTMRIRSIKLVVGFDGTAAATTSNFRIRRFDTATMSGGTAATLPGDVWEHVVAITSPTLADFRWSATALTTTSVVSYGYHGSCGVPRGATGKSVVCDWRWGDNNSATWYPILVANEGLGVTVDTTCVIGDSVSMTIEWDEY